MGDVSQGIELPVVSQGHVASISEMVSEAIASQVSTSSLTVERLTAEQFSQSRKEWDQLLARSNADPLFLSWAWNYSWWSCWQEVLGLELCVISVRSSEGQLLGIAPLYLHTVNYSGLTQVTRLQSIGNAWKMAPTVRSEYMGFIVDSEVELAAYQAIWQYLNDQLHWDELVLCDLDKESRGYRVLAALARMSQCRFSVASEDSGVKVGVEGSFEHYLSTLGRNTRLKLYNRRNRLAEAGAIEHIKLSASDYPQFFQQLNQLHATRWGRGCYTGLSEQFHLKLLSYLPEKNAHCLLMKQGEQVISALYDLELGGNRYNLQAGYLEHYHNKVSLGTLHLGYGLEQAWQTQDCRGYDLLAGSGKHSFYKRHLGRKLTQFATVRIIRSGKNTAWYRLFERLPSKWRQKLKRN
ncbi:GNAT family N-acetyltransferase [Corallincola platygyrae]|uniref:GNAT family N-acetyltransferase n=1 Tax=Corallincola platygyrae TaxID=1193278 RepID=A0ABW4XNQ2_9GAMM